MTDFKKQAADILNYRYDEKDGLGYTYLFEAAEEIIAELLKVSVECSCEYCGEHWGLGEYDSEFGDDKECKCGHAYYRHFDTYDQMRAIGCKYCHCSDFKEK